MRNTTVTELMNREVFLFRNSPPEANENIWISALCGACALNCPLVIDWEFHAPKVNLN